MDRSARLYRNTRLSPSHKVDDLEGYLGTFEPEYYDLIKTAGGSGIIQLHTTKPPAIDIDFVAVETAGATEYGYVSGIEEINNAVTRIHYLVDPVYSYPHVVVDGMVTRALFPRRDQEGKAIRYLSDPVAGSFSSHQIQRDFYIPPEFWQILVLGKSLSNTNPQTEYGISVYCYPVSRGAPVPGGSMPFTVGTSNGTSPPMVEEFNYTYFNDMSNIVPDDILYGALCTTPPIPVTRPSGRVTVSNNDGRLVSWPKKDGAGNVSFSHLIEIVPGAFYQTSIPSPWTPSSEPMLDFSPCSAYAVTDARGLPLTTIPDIAIYDSMFIETVADGFSIKTIIGSGSPFGGWSAEIQNWGLSTIDSDAYLSYLVLQKQADISALKRADKMDQYQLISSIAQSGATLGINAGISASLGRAGKAGSAFGSAGFVAGSIGDVFTTAERRKQRWAEQRDNESILSKSPDQVQQQGSGGNDLFTRAGRLYVSRTSIDNRSTARYLEYIKRYGYADNRMMRPSDALKYREHWDYIKCEGVVVTGCNSYIGQLVAEAYNDGFTMWHDHDILNYNRSNSEV